MTRLTRRGFLAAALAAGAGAAMGQGAVTDVAGEDRTEIVDGVAIRFRRFGRGRPVTLLHGASGNLNDMTFRLAPALVDAGHEVIVFDRPGHGASAVPPGGGASLAVQAALMRRALAAAGIRRTLLVGHSYGGSVALAWAVDAPESVAGLLLLAAPSHPWPGGLGLTTDLLANRLVGPAIAAGVPHLLTRGFIDQALAVVFAPQPVPPGYLDHLGLHRVLQAGSLRENARQLSRLKEDIRAMVPRYPGLAMPIEQVHGMADGTVWLEIHSARLAAEVPGARLTRLPGIGHMPHQVATGAVLDAMSRLAARAGA